jgi:hypothetical protein
MIIVLVSSFSPYGGWSIYVQYTYSNYSEFASIKYKIILSLFFA